MDARNADQVRTIKLHFARMSQHRSTPEMQFVISASHPRFVYFHLSLSLSQLSLDRITQNCITAMANGIMANEMIRNFLSAVALEGYISIIGWQKKMWISINLNLLPIAILNSNDGLLLNFISLFFTLSHKLYMMKLSNLQNKQQ